MRRKAGTLVPLEADILGAALELRRGGDASFHGFQLARQIAGEPRARALTAHGTLYKALARLQEAGLLAATWEHPEAAAAEGRPRRKLYELTGAGERALAAWQTQRRPAPARPRPGLETP